MNLGVTSPWVLTALLLVLLPLFNNGISTQTYPCNDNLPGDWLSQLYSIFIKVIAVLALASLILGLAGLYQNERWIEKIGHGANMVLLFDRSSSMDQTFAGKAPDGEDESKATAAKRFLLDFINSRKHDRIGVASYSTSPLFVMPLTENKSPIAAAISATNTPGLAYTNISKGLGMALSFYQSEAEKHTTGSKIILLVSDGAAAIDEDNKRKIRRWIMQSPVRLYWIFLRGKNSPGIFEKPEDPRDDNPQSRAERYLHLFFKSLNIPYQAYEADNPSAIGQAIDEINRLENLPIHYQEKIPRQDLTDLCYKMAAGFIMLLITFKLIEART